MDLTRELERLEVPTLVLLPDFHDGIDDPSLRSLLETLFRDRLGRRAGPYETPSAASTPIRRGSDGMMAAWRRPPAKAIWRPASLILTCLLLAVSAACRKGGEGEILAVRDVTVIAGDGGPPLADATVVVRGRRIDTVGVGISAPQGARVVDGHGRYLLPGLFEMHAHTSKARASALGLFVANGVTTVRDVGGDHQELLRWRRQIRAGERVGPRLLIAGPYLESADNVERMWNTPPEEMVEPVERTRVPIGTPERARIVIDSLARLELDFLKLRTVQDRPTYRALNAAAEARGLKLVGHTFGIPAPVVLAAGQDGIDHFLYPTLDSLSSESRRELWKRFADRGVGIVPTLIVTRGSAFRSVESLHAVVADSLGEVDPRRRYISRFLALDWREQAQEATDNRVAYRRIWESTVRNLREMHEAGMMVLPGTDVAVIDIYPGFSLHEELAFFVDELAMTPMEALESATREPAEFLGLADSVGTIAPGMIADMVLLDADPLEDVRNTTRISAVFLRGALYDGPRLDRILARVESARDQTVNDWPRAERTVP